MAIEDIYLVHHSHTDLGYTHSPEIATEMHCRFIDQALDLADQTRDWPDGSQLRWTCEVMSIVSRWIDQAPTRQIDRLIEASQAESVEVTALWCNLTPLFDTEQLYQLAGPIERCRSIGIPVRSAMNSDVNGLPWGIVDLLLDMGVDGISMAINEHLGRAPFNRPNAFRWIGPTGRSIPVWNGFLYNDSRYYGIPQDIEDATKQVPELMRRLEAENYPYDFLMFQSTYPDFSDNGPPNPGLCSFVREWNARGLKPRMRICTLSQFLARLRDPDLRLNEYCGEWADTWALGVASAARETMVNRENHDRLIRANTLRLVGLDDEAWQGQQSRIARDALHSMSLYDEHTFGSNISVGDPDHPRVIAEWSEKANTAYLAQSWTQLAERNGMIRLMQNIDHRGDSGVILYNPSPYPVDAIAQVPQHWLTPPTPMALPHMLSPTGYGQSALKHPILWTRATDLAAWSYRWIPADQWTEHFDATQDITATENSLESDSLRLILDERTGGIASLTDKSTGFEFVDSSQGPLGGYVYETIDSPRGRKELFGDDDQAFVSQTQWKSDWPSLRRGGRCTGPATLQRHPDRVSLCQKLEAPGVTDLEYRFTLYPHREGVEFEVFCTLPDERSPHGIYLTFPFALESSACHYESAGAVINAHRDLLPETCRDFLSVQRWIDISDDRCGVEIVTPDVPLWMLSDFCLGRLAETHGPKPTLIACLANNYWVTNFRASQPGKLRFRMVLCPHEPFNAYAAAAQSQAVVHEPQTIPTTGQTSGHWPCEGRLLHIDADFVTPISLTPVSSTEVLLRLSCISSTKQKVRVHGSTIPIIDAWQADPVGARMGRLDIKSGMIEFEMVPKEIRNILLEVDCDGASEK